jgi:hypothetical protein
LVLRSQVIDFIWPGLTVIAIVGFRFWKFCLDNGLRLIIPLQPTRPSPGEEFFCWVHIPNFFLVGAPKCATTAVAVALGCQADIFMSEPKEPTYFLFARGNPYGFDRTTRISDLESYLALFQNAGQRKIYGEASPLYFHAPYVAEEIVRFNPQAKIMAILRDPVERACSMYHFFYQHDRRATVSREDFRRKFFDGSVVHIPVGPATMRMEHLRSFGFYRRLLQPYYDHFDRNQILVLTHDDLRSDSQHFMRRVLAFLEVEALSPPVVPIANVTFQPRSREMQYWLNHAVHSKPREILKRVVVACPGARTFRDSFNRFNQRPFVPAQFLSDDLHRELIATYQEDLESLCRLVGRDFTPWLEHKPVCEGKPSNGALAV